MRNLFLSLIATLFLISNINAAFIPNIPLGIQVIENVVSPIDIDVSTDGIIYTASDTDSVQRIYQGTVSTIGSVPDLAVIAVDNVGIISGEPGSVLAGSNENIVGEIDWPFLSSVYRVGYGRILSGTGDTIYGLDFNSLGHSFVSSEVVLRRDVFGWPQYLNQFPDLSYPDYIGGTRNIVIDVDDNVYIRHNDNVVRQYDINGNLLSNSLSIAGQFAFSPGGNFPMGLYSIENGVLNQINNLVKVPIATGLGVNDDLTFDDNGVLYISRFDDNQVLVINHLPEPNTVILAMLTIICSSITRIRGYNVS